MLGVTVPGFDVPGAAARKVALDALDSLGMAGLKDRSYVHLSGGERQRVHIARALCQLAMPTYRGGETRCFLLDEPTASLDLAHQTLVLAACGARPGRPCRHGRPARPQPGRGAGRRHGPAGAGPGGGGGLGHARCCSDDLLSAAYGLPVLHQPDAAGQPPFVLPAGRLPGTRTASGIPRRPESGATHVLAS